MDASLKMALDRQGYRLIGDGGAVKVCHWCKESMKTGRGCYKQKFYGIDSHRCIQMTPNVHQCNEMCLFCWRYQGYQLGNDNPVDPVELIEGSIEAHRKLIVGWKGDPRVPKAKFEEAWNPNQVAISLSGEPTMYKYLGELLAECHKRSIRTFLVTNGTGPAVLERLDPLPYQLYVTVAAPTEDIFNRLCAPQTPRLWENLNKTLELLPSLSCRTVIRHTLVKGWNLEFPDGFAAMDKVADPDFIEPKGYVWVGDSRNRLAPENMPSFSDIRAFSGRVAELNGLSVLDADETSRVCLLGDPATNRWVQNDPMPAFV
jgi:tRNA wybutosine-synthesizing protein 1